MKFLATLCHAHDVVSPPQTMTLTLHAETITGLEAARVFVQQDVPFLCASVMINRADADLDNLLDDEGNEDSMPMLLEGTECLIVQKEALFYRFESYDDPDIYAEYELTEGQE